MITNTRDINKIFYQEIISCYSEYNSEYEYVIEEREVGV
jgi:hypothetical protein